MPLRPDAGVPDDIEPCGPNGSGGTGTFQVVWHCFEGCEFGSPLQDTDRLTVTDFEFVLSVSTDPTADPITGQTVGAYCATEVFQPFLSFGWLNMEPELEITGYQYYPPVHSFNIAYTGIPGTLLTRKQWFGIAYPL
jgi:hypothetical protein